MSAELFKPTVCTGCPDCAIHCRTCPRELVQQRAWEKASPNQRQHWLNQGKTVLQGRGLCRGCYLRLWKKAKRLGVSMQAVA